MTTLSTHVLDLASGMPAAGVDVKLYVLAGERRLVARATTNADGRTDAPLATGLAAGTYEIVYDAGDYFARSGRTTMFGEIPVRFALDATVSHRHVPLLLAPYGYSTYRGS